MSQSKNQYEAGRWLQTAEEDLDAARLLQSQNMHSHACFMAQQGAEKALKALWIFFDEEPWGHSIQRLVQEFDRPDVGVNVEEWTKRAVNLDRYYIPTRYPNGLPDLTPGQNYLKQDGQQAIAQAEFLFNACKNIIDEHTK